MKVGGELRECMIKSLELEKEKFIKKIDEKIKRLKETGETI
jgi:hypothetical protein